jgi:hypothetical protein
MVHQRSLEKIKLRRQKQMARQYIFSHAFQDQNLAEQISRSTTEEVRHFLYSVTATENVDAAAIPQAEKGLVLVDSRGRGAFQ